MLVYTCINTGDELFTDSTKIEGPDAENCFGVLYKFQAKQVSEGGGGIDERLIGGNKSAEGGDDEGVEEAQGEMKLDVVHQNRLKPTSFAKKKDVAVWLKDFMKSEKFKAKQAKLYNETEQKEWEAKMGKAFKFLVEDLDNVQFYQGEKQEYESAMLFCLWNEDGMSSTCYAIKDSVEEVKQ